MYINDKQWDNLINESCDVVSSISNLSFPKDSEMNAELIRRKNMFYVCSGMLQAFINLNNEPISLNSINHIQESKYAIFKWAIKQIFSIKRKSYPSRLMR